MSEPIRGRDIVHDGRRRKALVTGATGFIGRHAVRRLREEGWEIVAITRTPAKILELLPGEPVMAIQADLSVSDDLGAACKQVDTVFHLAGYAHAEDQESAQAARHHRQVTVDGTRALLSAAVSQGVRRFVFLSSVKAMGEGGNFCSDETMPAQPKTHYGRAKLEAEKLVLAAGRDSGMHVSVLRLPLVYGPGSKGNIPRMIAAVDQGRFPPLPDTQNKRSMVHVDDVVQALMLAEENPAANGQVFIVTDSRAYSTRALYEAICVGLGRAVPVWTVPAWALRVGAKVGDMLESLLRRRMPLTTNVLEKLFGSAWYSPDKIRRELGFVPRYAIQEALPGMIAEYRKTAAS